LRNNSSDKGFKRIVIINQDSGYLMIDLANSLAEYGDVTLIAGRVVKREKPLSDKIKLEKIIQYSRKSTLFSAWTWIVGFLQILFIVKTKHRRDYLLIVSNPPLATLLPLFCKNRFSLMIYDVYPDALHQMGILSGRSILLRSWKKANKRIFYCADHIYTLTDGMAGLLSYYYEMKNIRIVPMWSCNNFFRSVPRETNPFSIKNNLLNRFIVLYSGNLGGTHNIGVIPEIALRIKNQNVLFLIIGDGDQKKHLTEEIKRLQLRNCLMLPLQPSDIIPYSFASADIGIVSLGKKASSLSLPSKTFNYMSAGLPLLCIACDNSELKRLVTKYDNGRCFMPDKISEIVSFISEMADNRELLERYKSNSLKASLDFTPRNADLIAEEIKKSIYTN
jgi:glycosyltransferase involved in cell wall biosynthesis